VTKYHTTRVQTLFAPFNIITLNNEHVTGSFWLQAMMIYMKTDPGVPAKNSSFGAIGRSVRRSKQTAKRPAGIAPILVLAPLVAAVFTATACAAPPPQTIAPPKGLNLGSTSFFDGFGRQSPGWTVIEYDRYEALDSINGPGGAANPYFQGTKINVAVALTQVVYTSAWRPLGGHVAFSAALPVVDFLRSSFSSASPVKLANNGLGVGDLVWGPIYQSKVFTKDGRPKFVWRAQLIISSPTGGLNSAKDINQGAGYWAINPYVTFSYFPTDKIEVSNRFNYQYNFAGTRFSDPPPIPRLRYRNGQAGQIVYDNFATSYAISKHVNPGVNGYVLEQLNSDRTNGATVPHSIEEELYLGPGMRVRFDDANSVNLNSYMKVISKDAVSGLQLNMQFVHRL